MRYCYFMAVLLAIMSLSSCKSQYEKVLAGGDEDAKYRMAFQLFEDKKYVKAAELFESLSVSAKGTSRDDTVQFYWALSNYKYGDFVTAESNLNQFIITFPLSPFEPEARFLRIDCLYQGTYRYELDQKPTQKALTAIVEFINENPQSTHMDEVLKMQDDLNERLELKSYKSAYLYYHMEDYMAAHWALKNVLKENADNRYREEILYYTAMSAYRYAENSIPGKQKERYMTFVDDYFNVVSEYPDSHYRKELDSIYSKVQKILKKYNTVNDGQSETNTGA